MDKSKSIQEKIEQQAKKFYPDAKILAKDISIESEDSIWRFILVSEKFAENAPWDDELYLELRNQLNSEDDILKSVEGVFILVQPVSKLAFERENGDIDKVTNNRYRMNKDEPFRQGATSAGDDPVLPDLG